MPSFTPVVSGNPTNATDINQLLNALNGTTASQITIKSTSNTTPAYFGYLPSAPGSNVAVFGGGVTGDGTPRSSLYVGSSGYGGVMFGLGSTPVAHIHGVSGGATIDENFTVSGSFTASSSSSFAGATFSAGVSISGALTLSAGGTVNGGQIPGLIGGGKKISVQGSAPGSPSVNDVWINTSTNLG